MTKSIGFKKAAALLAAGTLAAVGLAACSGGEEPAAEAGGDAESVSIEYWHRLPDQEGMILVSQSADEWNKANPDIQVKATKFEGDATASYDKISAAVQAGNAPCLAQASYDGIPAMLARGELMDVTEFASAYQGNYASGPWGQTSPGGNTYGLPQDTGPLVYYYNKAAFDELGLSVPTSWDEYWQTAAKAKEAGKYTSAFFTDEAGDWFGAVVAANGATWFATEGDAWKVDVNGDATKKVAEEWQKSIDEGTTLATQRWGDPSPFDTAVKDGQVIGYVGAAWEAAFNLGSLGVEEANWQVAQVPGGQSGPWGGSAIVVLKGCEHPEQALKFADWYNTNMEAMASQGLVPAAKGQAPTPEAVQKLYGGQDVMAELAKAADSANPNWAYSPTWPAVKQSLIDNAANLGSGGNLSANLDKAQEEAIGSLKAANIKVVE